MSILSLNDIHLVLPRHYKGKPCFLDDEHVFINIFSGDSTSSLLHSAAPPTLKIRRLGPLLRGDGSLREAAEPFEVPPNVQSLTVVVSVDNPRYSSIQLGRIELDISGLQELSRHHNNRFIVKLNDAPPVVFSSACIYLPPDEKRSPDGLPSHTHHQQTPRLLSDDNKEFDRLNILGDYFARRFLRSGDLTDTEKAISHLESALHLTPDGHIDKFPLCLNHLGNILLDRFRRLGNLMDIQKAISHLEHALHITPDGNTHKPARLGILGLSFTNWFKLSGDPMVIGKAISYQEHALDLIPDGHADKPHYLNNLGCSFWLQFLHSGDLKDIDKSISHLEHALHLFPDHHVDCPDTLNNLGISFLDRFKYSNDLMDIGKAISHLEHALRLIPDGHAHRAVILGSLGGSFSRRFHQSPSRDLIDIDKSISYFEHALHLTPDGHPTKHMWLSNLGNSLLSRSEHSEDLKDIEKSMPHIKHALLLTPDSHANKPRCLSNLGISFMGRFRHSGDLMDIDESISLLKYALHLIPDGHAEKPVYLNSLGNALLHRYNHSRDPKDLSQAILSYKACATSVAGRPSTKYQAALSWARLSHKVDPTSSLSGYKTALSLLPRVAWLGQTLSSRYQTLTTVGDIAAEAASAAIDSERPDTALEWLEQGRSIVWGQVLNLRTPVDHLREVNPTLADDLEQTSQALEMASSHDTNPKDSAIRLSLEDAAQKHRRLAEKWEDLLKSIRMLSGFEDFLLPRKVSTLSRAAQSGPVVVINVHKSRSDALVLLGNLDDVLHIPLNSFYDKAHELQRSLSKELRDAGVRLRDARGIRIGSAKPDNRFEKILSSLWTDIVKPVLDGLGFNNPSTSDLPRIWWCLTGPLTFLPIHAAGLYDQSPPGPDLSDFAVSSYTPTVTALLEAVQETPKMYRGLLGVSQSATPGKTRLPNADKELDIIKKFDSSLKIQNLPGELATVDRVLKGMEDMSWVHLACHAVQDPSSPTESALCLHNGDLTLSKIITKSFPNADFAFLSACQTATGDKKLPDEAVHLAAGMLAAGYRSVIATMWSIRDEDAPLIASQVYPRLLGGPAPDSAMAARALHHAVKELRRKSKETGTDGFLSWVPFIHVGK